MFNKFLVQDLVKEYVNKKARIELMLDKNYVIYNNSKIELSDEEVIYFKELLQSSLIK